MKTYHNNRTLLDDLLKIDVMPAVNRFLDLGWIIDGETGKLMALKTALIPDAPWIYVNPNENMKCRFRIEIFNTLGFIPERCMSCWKVVVAPRNIRELFLLLELQEEMAQENPECWCKCGIERRSWVPRQYGGYFYNDTLALGRERCEQVRKMVDKYIGKKCSVFLKRGCTEFELKYKPTDKWEEMKTDKQREQEQVLLDNTILPEMGYKQPEFLKNDVIKRWLLFAYDRGDNMVTYYNNNRPFYTPSKTYHLGD